MRRHTRSSRNNLQMALPLEGRGEAPVDQSARVEAHPAVGATATLRSAATPAAAGQTTRESVGGRGRGAPLPAHLMESVVEAGNMARALRRVRGNKGSPGVDGMTVAQLPGYLREHWPALRAALLEGSYQPQAIRRVEIPKP